MTQRVLPALLHPGTQPVKTGRTGDVINEKHGVDVPIVMLHQGLPEALLTCSVPQLELISNMGNKKQRMGVRRWLQETETFFFFFTWIRMRTTSKRKHVLTYFRAGREQWVISDSEQRNKNFDFGLENSRYPSLFLFKSILSSICFSQGLIGINNFIKTRLLCSTLGNQSTKIMSKLKDNPLCFAIPQETYEALRISFEGKIL